MRTPHTDLASVLLNQINDRGTELGEENKGLLLNDAKDLEKRYDNEVDKLVSEMKSKLMDLDRRYKLELGSDRVESCVERAMENVYKSF